MWPKRTDLQKAWRYFQAQRWQEAEQIAQKAIKERPQAEAYYLLGLIASKAEDWLNARRQFQKAVDLDPWYAPAQYSLGLLLHQLGLTVAAIPHYTKAVEIKPDWAEAQINLGNAHLDLAQLDQAIQSYQAALTAQPDAATAMFNMGTAFQAKGLLTEALACYEQALQFNPQDSDAHNNLGSLYVEMNRYPEALGHFDQALTVDPHHVKAAFNRGRIFQQQQQMDQAAEIYQQVLELEPDLVAARLELAHIYLGQGRYDLAMGAYQTCLKYDRNLAMAHNGLGTTLLEQGHLEPALQAFDQACQLSPEDGDIRLNRAMTLLLKGDYKRGWAEYEWRWQHSQATLHSFEQPAWDGQPLEGRTLLIYAEQGLGDVIQFSRYLPWLQTLGGPILLETPLPLYRLLQPLNSHFTRIPQGQPLPKFDCHAPLLSLPFLLGLETIPPPLSLLTTSGLEVSRVSGYPQEAAENLRVGLVWQTSAHSPTAPKRSCPLELLLPLASIPEISLFSLQKDITLAEGTQLAQAGIFDCSPHLEDFADTAAWLRHLDLVISVDTAVAHLSGSLGMPTAILLPFIPDWRWQLKRPDSPWYPTVQLFRQTQANAWQTVIPQIKDLILRGISMKKSRMTKI
ncbi:tetratricopeptide repeat protein [Thermosynechococcaceae cyanobacterium BACA0444]|uniref:Tetratricopeptide repeat protein n=1 Tax=Pseudocalidococcus azoricus BACA0444 TaxID=2918990 RepID=A0AAE4FNN0_9CYAN|nr:tetratricopeptide repeat protein [Pseudocalidococcus azoricus]MDS3859428.1 tetratricopeptide repeat protein [Pseudocalidococcus azoricus BACA0444]